MTHPDSLTGADVFDVPDTSLSPSDPAELVAWLRGLPGGTVLLDTRSIAWQIHPILKHVVAVPADGWDPPHHLVADEDFRGMAKFAPFRVIWTSGGE